MTLRRYAPLALAALALGCKPDIEQRANATTVDYAYFDPAGTMIPLLGPVIPTPNDVALSKVAAYLPGGAAQSLPCNLAPPPPATPNATTQALCAYARAGGFPAPSPVSINFVRGTLGGDGSIEYGTAPAGEAMNTATLKFANGIEPAPTLGVFDLDATAPTGFPQVPSGSAFDPATGALTLTAPGGLWTAGHQYAVVVRGGASGPKTLAGGPYTATPTFYILREAVIADLDLSKPENQGLFPGDAAAKAASGAALEQLRANYETLYSIGGFGAAIGGLGLPFGEAISLQTFQIAPGGTVTIGDGSGQANSTVTAPAVGQVDAFSLQSSLQSATIVAVTFDLTSGAASISELFVAAAADCTGAKLGTNPAPAAGSNTIPLTTWPNVGSTAATNLYVCATTSAAGTVQGTATAVSAFPGTGFTSAGTDATSATLTVN